MIFSGLNIPILMSTSFFTATHSMSTLWGTIYECIIFGRVVDYRCRLDVVGMILVSYDRSLSWYLAIPVGLYAIAYFIYLFFLS